MRKTGDTAEDIAHHYLQQQGLKPIARNFNTRFGEIDLIMCDKADLAFIEVRYGKTTAYGHPAETVTYTKQTRLIRAAQSYLKYHRQHNHMNCRFDVIAIQRNMHQVDNIQWIKNAFQVE